ncbi:MAG: PD40 domain-containing protein [Bacteroidales bacterium]|nr:PD40 domain-containing protein [Bacteroidales bacterium]MBN2819970.1 PD40 domain-containing protein [Bacteroidales bacterium]
MRGLKQLLTIQIVAVFFLLGESTILKSQELSKDEIEAQSIAFFNSENYSEALKGFEDLLLVYPREPSYNYYLGRCYLHSNVDLESAIQYLRFAASKTYSTDVHYYLSQAYLKNYQFEDAELALANYKVLGTKKDFQKLKPGILEESIKSARQETLMACKAKVLATENILSNQLGSIYALHVPGRFAPKPESFMILDDKKENYQGVMYLPTSISHGDQLYISSIGSSRRTGKDLYVVKQLSDIDYSAPDAIEELNTAADEEYPYFDKASSILYFASDRPGGMGGFDIYSSKYDISSDAFENPRRLEFPYNSPFDDFLYVPDTAGKTAVFLSNRKEANGKLTAYKVEIPESPDFLFPKSVDEVRELAGLNVKTEEFNVPVVIENLSPARSEIVFSEYEVTIKQALNKQLFCDSLNAEIISKKNKLLAENNADNRRILIANITKDESLLKETQQTADELFAEANRIRQNEDNLNPGNLTMQGTASLADNTPVAETAAEPEIPSGKETETQENENIESVKSVGKIKLFAYKTSIQLPVEEENLEEINIEVKESRVENNFTILDNSPYSIEKPIPGNNEMPQGLVYKIQLGAFSQDLSFDAFGGLSPLSAEILEDKNLTKYYVGLFKSSKAARDALQKVKSYGYSDAFIVPYYNRRKITIQAARELEYGEKFDSE